MIRSGLILYLLLMTVNCKLKATEICKLIINTVTPNPQNEFYIMSQSTFICEGNQKPTDTFLVEIPEPLPCFYIVHEDTSKHCAFWIEPGTVQLNIDAYNVRKSVVVNSELNNIFYNYKRKNDSIFSFVNYNLKALGNQDDSLSAIYNKHEKELYRAWYKDAFRNTNNFYTLSTLKFHLGQYLSKQEKAAISKKELWKLFKKLDKKMKTYPTYKKCEALFKQEAPKRPSVNEPLMK